MDRMALLSESATYSSILLFDIIPRLRPEGCAHSQLLMSDLLLRFPSLPEPEKTKPLLVLRFNAQI